MADKPDARTVELVAGVDITKLPLGPQEGFVISRIQGRSRVSEIANLVGGMAPDELEQTLRKLSELGAVRLLDASGRPLSDRAPQPQIITPLPGPPPARRRRHPLGLPPPGRPARAVGAGPPKERRLGGPRPALGGGGPPLGSDRRGRPSGRG